MANNLLKITLDKHGISQVELAKKSSTSSGTVNKVCNKNYTPAPKTKSKLTIALNKLADTEYEVEEIFL
jgi:DNA-binding XRE family transcriptional regulator